MSRKLGFGAPQGLLRPNMAFNLPFETQHGPKDLSTLTDKVSSAPLQVEMVGCPARVRSGDFGAETSD